MQSELLCMLYDSAVRHDVKKAIISDAEVISYHDLFDAALRYKSFFEQRKVKRICIISQRSIKLYCMVLGVVLAGGSYFLYETRDIDTNVVKKIKNISPELVLSDIPYIELDNVQLIDEINISEVGLAECGIRRADDYIYYVTTSGTTGEGKIIGTKDKNLLCYLNGYIAQFDLNEDDVFFQQSPVFYDGFAEEFFSALIVGGTLVFTSSENLRNPYKIVEQLNKYHVTVFPSTPLIIGEINRMKKPVSVKRIVSSGDILKSCHIDWLINYTDTCVYNMYGLSESTVCATYHLCTKYEQGNLSIGRPLNGYEILLLDENGKEVTENKMGEIYICGEGVIEDYYVSFGEKDCIIKKDGKIMLKTGDYAWLDLNGELHYVGRKDRIIKNKSNKVNLNEIETILLENEAIKDVAVIFDEEKQWLLFFYVSDCLDDGSFRALCKKRLRPFMMPNQIYALESMPFSDTGKVDYKCLATLCNKDSMICNEAGKVGSEKTVLQCICNTLQNYNVDIMQTWENVGVDSFTYIMLLVDLEEEFKIEVGEELLVMDDTMTIKEFCHIVQKYLEGK